MVTESQFECGLEASFSLGRETKGHNTLAIMFDPLRIAFEPHRKRTMYQENE
jgi:hypothetical protein